jgi:hypothetical protein
MKLEGFQSTSIDPRAASSKAGSKAVQMRIRPKNGAYIQKLSRMPDEFEFLIPHGQTFKVTGKTKGKDGTLFIDLVGE